MRTEVAVNIDGNVIWAKWCDDSDYGGFGAVTSGQKPILEQAVSLLTEALEQAQGQLCSVDRPFVPLPPGGKGTTCHTIAARRA